MALPQQFLDEVRLRLPVSSVVGRKVRLIRKGREHHGLCPFHKEKTPSFTVNDDKGFYHCFGCGAHGDVISFEMETSSLSFIEAVEKLAAEAGLSMPQSAPEERENAKRRLDLFETLEAACVYFQKQLSMPEGRIGKEYLERRGIDATTIARFRLGWAPGGDSLKGALERRGVDEELLIEAGLLKRREDGSVGACFRNRVLFPITDRRNRVIAFGGRTLGDGQPKYLNSPDTPLFHKGSVLYNLAAAREAAVKSGRLAVVEGYMDVIAMTQADVPACVAPLGTALTETHLEELWRLADEPILCFDGDAAGRRAAVRAAERALPLLRPGKSLRFARLPGGKDPDEVLRRHGAPALREGLNAAQSLVETLWRLTTSGADLSTPERRAALENVLTGMADRIAHKTVAQHYRQNFRERLRALLRPVRTKNAFVQGFRSPPAKWKTDVTPQGPLPTESIHQRILLTTLITHPELYDAVGERLGLTDFSDPDLDKLREAALILLAQHPNLDFEGIGSHLHACGLERELAFLLASDVFVHAAFARPDAPTETARQGWEDSFRFVQQKDLKADVAMVRDRLANEMTDENFRLFLALKQQTNPSEID